MLKKFRKNTGSSLVEVLVAVLVVGLVITAVMLSMTYSVKNSAEARYREVASQLAQNAMEIVVLNREVDAWSTFYDKQTTGKYCLTGGTTLSRIEETSNCTAMTNGNKNYTRYIRFSDKITVGGVRQITATVIVEWSSDSNQTQDVKISQKFFERAI